MSGNTQNSHIYFFAYGSLKQDYFFGHLMKDQQFIGESYLEGSFQMFIHPESFPCIIPCLEAASKVQGELFLLRDHSIIADLDILEGHPEEYTRTECKVRTTDATEYKALVYIYNATQAPEGSIILQNARYHEDKKDDEYRRKIIIEHGLGRFLK